MRRLQPAAATAAASDAFPTCIRQKGHRERWVHPSWQAQYYELRPNTTAARETACGTGSETFLASQSCSPVRALTGGTAKPTQVTVWCRASGSASSRRIAHSVATAPPRLWPARNRKGRGLLTGRIQAGKQAEHQRGVQPGPLLNDWDARPGNTTANDAQIEPTADVCRRAT